MPSGLQFIVAASALASPFSSRNLCTCKLANYLLLHVSHCHKSSPFFYLFIKLPVNCMFSLTAGQTLITSVLVRFFGGTSRRSGGKRSPAAKAPRPHGRNICHRRVHGCHDSLMPLRFFFFSAHSFPIHDHIGRITDVLNQPERRQNSLECIKR